MSIRTGVMPIVVHDHTSACGVSILGSTGYGFDAAGRLQNVTDGTNAATYSYLANSRLIGQIAYARSGQTVMIRTNQYDALNRLVKTETQDAQQAVLASFAYGLNAAHQRTSVTNADGAYWVYQYDSLGQVTSGRKYWANATPVLGQQFDYTFDDIGNRQTAVTGGDASGHNRRYQHYTANSRNQYEQRLVPGYLEVTGSAATNATVTLNNQAVTRQGEYFWGELGLNNSTGSVWLSLTNLGVLAVSTNSDVAVTNTGQLFLPQTPEAFAHDADGNLTNDGRWNDTWDAENRLVRMVSRTDTPTNSWRSLTFGYDPQGRRISKTVSNWVGSAWQLVSDERFAFDGWNCLAILHSSFSLLHSFTWGLDLSGSLQGAGGVGGLLWLSQPSTTNSQQFVAFDGNGNVAALVCATNGAVTANYEYGPFGEVLRATGPMAKVNPFRFSTKYQDEETDLFYYGFRYYDASMGRWIGLDTIEEFGGNNVYAFVGNRSLSHFDLLGLISPVDTGHWPPIDPGPTPPPPTINVDSFGLWTTIIGHFCGGTGDELILDGNKWGNFFMGVKYVSDKLQSLQYGAAVQAWNTYRQTDRSEGSYLRYDDVFIDRNWYESVTLNQAHLAVYGKWRIDCMSVTLHDNNARITDEITLKAKTVMDWLTGKDPGFDAHLSDSAVAYFCTL